MTSRLKERKSSGKKRNVKKKNVRKQERTTSMFEASLSKLNKLSKQRHSYSGKGNLSKSKSTYFSSTTNIHGKKEKKMKKNYSGVGMDFGKRRKSRNTYTGKRRKRMAMAGNKSGNNQGKKKKKLSRYGQIKRKLEFSNPGYSKGKKGMKKHGEGMKKKRSRSQFRSNSFDKGYVSGLVDV